MLSDDYSKKTVLFVSLLRFVLLTTNDCIWCNSIHVSSQVLCHHQIVTKWGREEFSYLLNCMRKVMRWVSSATRFKLLFIFKLKIQPHTKLLCYLMMAFHNRGFISGALRDLYVPETTSGLKMTKPSLT